MVSLEEEEVHLYKGKAKRSRDRRREALLQGTSCTCSCYVSLVCKGKEPCIHNFIRHRISNMVSLTSWDVT